MFLFEEEVNFFQLGEQVIARLRESEGYKPPPVEGSDTPKKERAPCLNLLWNFLEHPGSSRGATGFAVFSVSIILLSIVMFVVESMPIFRLHMFHTPEEESANKRWLSFCVP